MPAGIGYPPGVQIGSGNTINQDNIFGDNIVNLATGLLNEQGLPITNANMTQAILGIQQNPQLAQRLQGVQNPGRTISGSTAPISAPSQFDSLGIDDGPLQSNANTAAVAQGPNPPQASNPIASSIPPNVPNSQQASQPAQSTPPTNANGVNDGSDYSGIAAAVAGLGAGALAAWLLHRQSPPTPEVMRQAQNPEVMKLLPPPLQQELKVDVPLLSAPESEPLDMFQMRPTADQRGREALQRSRTQARQQTAANAPVIPDDAQQMRPGAEATPIENLFDEPNAVQRAPNGEPVEINGSLITDYDTAPWNKQARVYRTEEGRWYAADGSEIPAQFVDSTGELVWNRGNQIPPELVQRVNKGFAAAARTAF